ncbi:MAG: YtxH domain-containing protein [Bacteroidetes bacterium]|nr:YtxH domain-containing protein [Bacteroidota bacterium]
MSQNNGNELVDKIIIASLAFLGGVAVGMLFAPKSGKENRQWVKDQARKMGATASELGKKAGEKFSHVVDKMSGTPQQPVSAFDDESTIYNEPDRKS